MSRQGHEQQQPQLPFFTRLQQQLNGRQELQERGYELRLPTALNAEFAWAEAEYPQVCAMLTQLGEHHALSLVHTLRVACTAANNPMLSRFEGARREIFLAGLVHDAGKLQTDADLLKKPGRPDVSEKSDLEDHVENTIDFCRANGIPESATRIAAVHHQVLDLPGNRYGQVVYLNELQLDQAKRLAAADKIEAVTGLREYRKPETPVGLADMIKNDTTMDKQLALQTLSAMYLSGFLSRHFTVVAHVAIANS